MKPLLWKHRLLFLDRTLPKIYLLVNPCTWCSLVLSSGHLFDPSVFGHVNLAALVQPHPKFLFVCLSYRHEIAWQSAHMAGCTPSISKIDSGECWGAAAGEP
jgi:hypothetical protein